jgi:hypothetical protein
MLARAPEIDIRLQWDSFRLAPMVFHGVPR